MFKINIALIPLIIARSSALDTVPVFIQDDGLLDGVVKSQTNPLVKTNQDEFELVVDLAQKRSTCLIFFIEEELSSEDITSRDEKGTPYYHMKNAFLDKRIKMFPRVVHPYNYLKNRFQPFDFNTFHVGQTTNSLQLEDDYKFIYIFFEDGTNETRIEKLRHHDTIIQEVYFAVKQLVKGPVVAFYTGKVNPMVIEQLKKLHMPIPTPSSIRKADLPTAIPPPAKMRGEQLPMPTNNSIDKAGKDFDEADENSDKAGKNSDKEGKKFDKADIARTLGIPLKLLEIKEALLRSGEKSTKSTDTNTDEVYVSIVILTCTFVVFGMLGILFFGVHMIMNIHSNSIYDNPDQQPLFISDGSAD